MEKPGRSYYVLQKPSSETLQKEVLSEESCYLSTSARFEALSKPFLRTEAYTENCEGNFTLSGSEPPKTVGPLSKCHNVFAQHAPCGHWESCNKEKCRNKKKFEACETCPSKAYYGPYGPWSKSGPATFISPKLEYLKKVYPSTFKRGRNGLKTQPMGKQAPWPLSGSCRYAGRPYGPCRPFGAYKSRGPFGYWNFSFPERCRLPTPCQPCWRPNKPGCRPCTPCHRPLFRPCKPCKV